MTLAPPPPLARLSLGVTGHRESNRSFAGHAAEVEAVLGQLFARIDELVAKEAGALGGMAPTRLNNLLASGIDQLAASAALQRGWDVVAPLPFGRDLNLAINALPETLADAQALLRGEAAADPEVAARAATIRRSYDSARLFELAEQDGAIARLFLDKLAEPGDLARAQAFAVHSSERVAAAGRVMIEQSDILIAVWDGASRSHVGGTGHTIATALELGDPVIWIEPRCAVNWRILGTPESLIAGPDEQEERDTRLAHLVRAALRPGEGGALRAGAQALSAEAWHARSSRLWTGYRRVEALFGGDGRPFRSLVQTYETPDRVATGNGAPLLDAARAIAGADRGFVQAIEREVLRRLAWADGISSRLSDSYRGGMIANFLLSTLAIGMGIAYQPLGLDDSKWLFALTEFLLLCGILLITWLGAKLRWHKRWFETRRVAEYFRHAPILLLFGVARPPGRWPKGTDTSWPEYYARHGLRGPGLPAAVVDAAYLRAASGTLLAGHVIQQRDYHRAKAKRLTTVHHKLDHLSERLFQFAVLSVSGYLLIAGLAALGLVAHELPHALSKLFTFLGVMFPTLGASIAGIRYFGDFERFAAISEVTAEKLDAVHLRIGLLLAAPDDALDYSAVAELVHTVDDIVVSEIENWQAVFGGKHITVPV